MADAPDKIQWHPGFYGAMGLELRANLSDLRFLTEVELGKKPLRVDLLIVRVNPGVRLENEVGKIFKGCNIIEYKSPDDGLTIDDFFKTVGYACIYKGLSDTVNQIPEDDITVSLFRDTYPRELFTALKASGRTVTQRYPGIYYISGNLMFDTQIVVTSQLEETGHSAFRVLSGNAGIDDIRRFITETGSLATPGDRNNADAVLQVSIAANEALYDKVRRDSVMCEALERLMQDVIEEKERKAAEQAEQNKTTDYLKNLMSNLKMTAEQAMDALQIPADERSFYSHRLSRQSD